MNLKGILSKLDRIAVVLFDWSLSKQPIFSKTDVKLNFLLQQYLSFGQRNFHNLQSGNHKNRNSNQHKYERNTLHFRIGHFDTIKNIK